MKVCQYICSTLFHEYLTQLKLLSSDEHSSLFRINLIGDEKSFTTLAFSDHPRLTEKTSQGWLDFYFSLILFQFRGKRKKNSGKVIKLPKTYLNVSKYLQLQAHSKIWS
jgi:hypothetical protein